MLAQAVLDMEQSLDQEHRALAVLDRELERLARRDQVLAEDEARCSDSIAAGLAQTPEHGSAADRDALVRPLIRRRLETSRRRVALKARAAEVQAERVPLAVRSEAHAARLDDLRARSALAAPAATESAIDDPADPRWRAFGESFWSGPEASVGEAEVELELIRLRREAAGRGGAA